MTANDSKWLSLEDASEFIGLGKTTLYQMAREGSIPVSKVGKKWVFERTLLDSWIQAQQPMDRFFMNLNYQIDEAELREPQKEGYWKTYNFFKEGKNNALIQIPVGCGKSGLCSLLPLGLAEGRILVLAPNLTIKNELYDSMDVTNRQKCFWRFASVLSEKEMMAGPLACTLDSGNLSTASKSHIVITNVHQLATNAEKWLDKFPDDFFDMIIVDEAHHSAASSWKLVLERFPKAKVALLTATPFRSDRQKLDGELVYRYPFRRATKKGYLKRLKASYVAPATVDLTFSDKNGKSYSLEEVLSMKEKDWFSRAISLSKACNENIVDTSLAKLEDLRLSGTQHQLIAVACTVDHARQVASLYRERGYSSDVIYGDLSNEKKDDILARLRNGTLDCIVQVQMLGEGFNHPKLSVAAIFRPFRTLAPYIQFVGRILRVIVQNQPTHPDNLGHIVTHLGMNLDARLKEFREFESDDQKFWEAVIDGQEPEPSREVKEGKTRLRASESIVVKGEVVDSLWEEDFASHDEQLILDDLRERMELLGLDVNEEVLQELVKNSKADNFAKLPPVERFSVQPQREWEEAKRRLNDQAKRLATILLNHVELETTGTEIPYRYKSLKLNGKNNWTCALMMVHTAFKKKLGKPKEDCNVEDFKALLTSLEEILQPLQRKLRKAKSIYEEKSSQR